MGRDLQNMLHFDVVSVRTNDGQNHEFTFRLINTSTHPLMLKSLKYRECYAGNKVGKINHVKLETLLCQNEECLGTLMHSCSAARIEVVGIDDDPFYAVIEQSSPQRTGLFRNFRDKYFGKQFQVYKPS